MWLSNLNLLLFVTPKLGHLLFSFSVNATDDASEYDPGFMYYFLAAVADVAANPKINASGTYFQPNMAFSSSYKSFFNKTMPLFAPRAFRQALNLFFD